jgi:hypothetical protein
MKLEVLHNIVNGKTHFIVNGALVSGTLLMRSDFKNEPNKFVLEIDCPEVRSRIYPTKDDPYSVVQINNIE